MHVTALMASTAGVDVLAQMCRVIFDTAEWAIHHLSLSVFHHPLGCLCRHMPSSGKYAGRQSL